VWSCVVLFLSCVVCVACLSLTREAGRRCAAGGCAGTVLVGEVSLGGRQSASSVMCSINLIRVYNVYGCSLVHKRRR